MSMECSFLQISVIALAISSFWKVGSVDEEQPENKNTIKVRLNRRAAFTEFFKDRFDFIIVKLFFFDQFPGKAVEKRYFIF